ncbi:uncharacterized protein LOC141913133 [Tubulanus polymorphus]|uniref:uncharacterized protein LOC141913133 n=1 Tax=Tubulanus polymorphus TaxID=672921 RepID=UPI003DA20DA0
MSQNTRYQKNRKGVTTTTKNGPRKNGPRRPQPIGDQLKTAVRGVLLSKIGGVLENQFAKDFRNLVQSALQWKQLGYASLLAFMRAIPDCVRVEYDETLLQHRFFGIGADNTYMSPAAKKAEGKTPRSPQQEQGELIPDKYAKKTPRSPQQEQGELIPDKYANERIPTNCKGMYAIGYSKDKGPNNEQEIMAIFSKVGKVAEIGNSSRYVFIRYWTENDARKCLREYGEKYKLIIPEENRRGKKTTSPLSSKSSSTASSPSQSKLQDTRKKKPYKPTKLLNNNNSTPIRAYGDYRNTAGGYDKSRHVVADYGDTPELENNDKMPDLEAEDAMPPLEDDDDAMPDLEDDDDVLVVDDAMSSLSMSSKSFTSQVNTGRILVVRDFPYGTYWGELKDYFNRLGIGGAHVQMRNRYHQDMRTEAYVSFPVQKSIQLVMERACSNRDFEGCELSFELLDVDEDEFLSSGMCSKPLGMNRRIHDEMLQFIGIGSYLKTSLPLILDIRITHIVNRKFMFAHMMMFEPELRQLEVLVKSLNELPHRKPVNLQTFRGMAEYMGCFYRVYIMEHIGDKSLVFFVDYGNEDIIDQSVIYEVPDQFWIQPPAAVPFYVTNGEGCSLIEENTDVSVRYERGESRDHLEHILPISII